MEGGFNIGNWAWRYHLQFHHNLPFIVQARWGSLTLMGKFGLFMSWWGSNK